MSFLASSTRRQLRGNHRTALNVKTSIKKEQSIITIFSSTLLCVAICFGFYQNPSSGVYKILAIRIPTHSTIHFSHVTEIWGVVSSCIVRAETRIKAIKCLKIYWKFYPALQMWKEDSFVIYRLWGVKFLDYFGHNVDLSGVVSLCMIISLISCSRLVLQCKQKLRK